MLKAKLMPDHLEVQGSGRENTTKNPIVSRRRSKVNSMGRQSAFHKSRSGKYKMVWTALDSIRLSSLDNLYSRSREYHNNVHAFKVPETLRMNDGMNRKQTSSDLDLTTLPDEVMLEYMVCQRETPSSSSSNFVTSSPRTPNSSLHSLPPSKGRASSSRLLRPVTLAALDEFIARKAIIPQQGVLWINIKDSICLERVFEHFNLHPINLIYFQDLRAHSTFIENSNGLVLSLTSCRLHERETCVMSKLFVFVCKGLCITFEHELMPALDRPSSFHSSPVEAVSRSLMAHIDDSYDRFAAIGAPFLMFELVVEALALQDTLLEFCSIAIFHFSSCIKQSNMNLFDGVFDRQVRTMESVLVMLDTQAKDSLQATQQLADHILDTFDGNASEEFDRTFLANTIVDAQLSVSNCIGNELTAIRKAYSVMENTSSIAYSRMSVSLSMVATVFLPMSFLSGVFGMNFMYYNGNGRYTIAIQNDPNGPFYFMYLCFFVSVVAITYFLVSGWITPIRSLKILHRKISRRLFPPADTDSPTSLLRSQDEEVDVGDTVQNWGEAQAEEERRVMRSSMLRSHAHYTRPSDAIRPTIST